MNTPKDGRARLAGALGAVADHAAVRAELAEAEGLEDQVARRMAHLGTLLPRGQLRLVWELLDAEQRHGQAERLLAIRGLADLLAGELPDHAAAIRAAAGQLLGEGSEVA